MSASTPHDAQLFFVLLFISAIIVLQSQAPRRNVHVRSGSPPPMPCIRLVDQRLVRTTPSDCLDALARETGNGPNGRLVRTRYRLAWAGKLAAVAHALQTVSNVCMISPHISRIAGFSACARTRARARAEEYVRTYVRTGPYRTAGNFQMVQIFVFFDCTFRMRKFTSTHTHKRLSLVPRCE